MRSYEDTTYPPCPCTLIRVTTPYYTQHNIQHILRSSSSCYCFVVNILCDGLIRPLLASHTRRATTAQGLRELTLGFAKLVLSCDDLSQPF
jgi:hypothetical protein